MYMYIDGFMCMPAMLKMHCGLYCGFLHVIARPLSEEVCLLSIVKLATTKQC